ncbi:MAG: SAM-dependent methyltransferase [Bacteroidota bacterium]
MKTFGIKLYETLPVKVLGGISAMILILSLFMGPRADAQDLDVPFVATSNEVVDKMLEVADVGPGDYVIDLGSGDGRIVIAAAQRGAYGHGVDLDPERIEEARENAKKSNVSDRVMFLNEDIFETDFSRANIITMYLLSSVNKKLRPKLLDKLEPGTRMVSHDFDMGEWEPDKHMEVGNDDVYYWVIPADMDGEWQWQTDGNTFSMSVEQNYQEIRTEIREGNTTLNINDKVLVGKRLSLTAVNPDTGTYYVYNGEVNDGKIKGKVQIRANNNKTIKNWSANQKNEISAK